MFGSDVLDIGIGMSLLFLMMSLIATAVREAIEGVMKSRSKDLEKGLREMLDDGKEGNFDGLVGQIYKHALINSLYRGTLEKAKKGDLPSYIPSQSFVSALLDIVEEQACGRWHRAGRCRPAAERHPNESDDRGFKVVRRQPAAANKKHRGWGNRGCAGRHQCCQE